MNIKYLVNKKIALLFFLLFFNFVPNAISAEKLSLVKGIFSKSITIYDLETFAEQRIRKGFLKKIIKEEEAEKVKHEIRIIWGDYFKQPQFEKFPGVNDLVHEIMRTASGCKQEPSRATGEALVQQVNQFAEMFWATKEVETTTLPWPYPPSLPTVYPVIK